LDVRIADELLERANNEGVSLVGRGAWVLALADGPGMEAPNYSDSYLTCFGGAYRR
jgi:hypothetical protein